MATKKKSSSATSAHSIVMEGGTPNALGIRMLSVSRKKVVAEMVISKMHINRNGSVNGGTLMAFGDVLGAAGTIANLPAGYGTTTLESKTNFFAVGKGPVLSGVSIPLHIGRTTNVWQTTIKNADGRRVAIVTQTQFIMPARQPATPAQPAPASSKLRK